MQFLKRSPFIEWTAPWLLWALNTADTGWGSRGSDPDYRELLGYRTRGVLNVKEWALDWREDPLPLSISRDCGEGRTHQFGKQIAARWIEGLGGRPLLEARRYNGSVDVFCPVMHCGRGREPIAQALDRHAH